MTSHDRKTAILLSERPPAEAKAASERERFAGLARALARGGIEAEHRFAGDEDELRALLRETSPGLAFSAALQCAAGPRGRKNMHTVFEEAGVAYVGSEPAALELAIDKAALKEAWLAAGVMTPGFLAVPAEGALELARAEVLGFPCIVKPCREGNSRGIDEDSVARDLPALRERVEATRRRYGPVLVERFLGDCPDIREFTVAMLGSGGRMLALPVEIALVARKAVRLVTTEDKDEHRTRARPVDEPGLRGRIEAFARRAFLAAGVRDYARCDILLAGGELFAIEINGQPMLPDAWFAACCAQAGMDGTAYQNAPFLAALARLSLQSPRGGAPAIPDAMRDIVPPPVFESLCGPGSAER